jgi:4-hydroxybenzoate polyprenyltransferase
MIQKIKTWMEMIKIEHTLFSLPFVVSSVLLAQIHSGIEFKPFVFLWIALSLLGARSLGMTLNRIFDADIDALNPRTQLREIPSGKISKKQAYVFSFFSLVVLIYSAFQLPTLCQKLLPIALVWLFAYSWIKRFSCLCHFVLGTTLGGATLGAWIASTGSLDSLVPIYFSLAVSCWVAGFDIFYSIQDYDFDRKQNLHSIPAVFGVKNAILIARFLHVLTPFLLYYVGFLMNLGIIYKLGVLGVILALVYEARLVSESKIEKAFFTVNSWISFLIMLSIILDTLF